MSENVQIIRWHPEYRDDFVRLSREWIERLFQLEPHDLELLADPEAVIISPGGEIFLARTDCGQIVGCCALVFHPESERYELAKMAVDPRMQGYGIGYRLGLALLEYARKKSVGSVFLEGNTRLDASIALYRKLGFRDVPRQRFSYERCDVYMECTL